VPSEDVTQVLAGTLGHFWEWNGTPAEDLTVETRGGYLDIDGGMVRVNTLMEDDDFSGDIGLGVGRLGGGGQAQALVGIVPSGTVMVTGLGQTGQTLRFGNHSAASTRTYRGRNLVFGIQNLGEVRSPMLKAASAEFPGLLRWAGIPYTDVDADRDQTGRVQSARIALLPVRTLPAGRVRKGLRIEVEMRWSFTESNEQRSIETRLVIRCVSSQPVDADELVRALDHARFVLVLAFRGWIPAAPGAAAMDLRRGAKWHTLPQFWSSRLAEHPKGAQTARLEALPYFTLADLGGARGLARWVQLCEANRRVIQPLLMFHRNGQTSVEDHIIAMCAAAEYLVGSRGKVRGWQDVPGKAGGGLGKLHILAARLGAPWINFVGDLDRWADLLWKAYNDNKHYRKSTLDLPTLHCLAGSADLLLTCALLDAAAGNQKISKRFLQHHELDGLREALRQLTARGA
jgi:hypothetical protein